MMATRVSLSDMFSWSFSLLQSRVERTEKPVICYGYPYAVCGLWDAGLEG